jgi:hypothetical protein
MKRRHPQSIASLFLLALWTTLVAGSENAATRRFELVIHEREVVGGQQTLRVDQGDFVELAFTSDEAGELHLHGYDIAFEVGPAAPTVITFEARATGRFPVTSHGFAGAAGHGHAALLYIEVHPD